MNFYEVRDVHKALKRRIAAMMLEAEDVHQPMKARQFISRIIDSRPFSKLRSAWSNSRAQV